MLRETVSRPVYLGIKRPSGAYDQIFVTVRSCVFVDVGRFLWREDGSVIYNGCWAPPAQSFSGPSSLGLATIFYCLIRDFPFHRLPWLAGLRWRYSTPACTRDTKLKSKSKSKSHCDWRSVSQSVSQSVLVSCPTWGSWPDIYYCLTVTALLWGTLSDGVTKL
jgi:hypothetical protein